MVAGDAAPPPPSKTIPVNTNDTLMYAVGVVLAKPGRISALAAKALTSVYSKTKGKPLKATQPQ